MFFNLKRYLLYAAALVIGLVAGTPAQAQGLRYYSNPNPAYRDRNGYIYRDPRGRYDANFYDGRYTARRPVYDDAYAAGRTNTIVTQTPMGPVRSSSTIDPRTGEQVSTTYWRDPRTGQVTTSRRVVDPRTGEDRASTRTVDPYTGAVQRSRVAEDRRTGQYAERTSGVDPWTGRPYRSRSSYDPYFGETHEHEDPYFGGSRVVIPYRP
jgi:hypothetical protein